MLVRRHCCRFLNHGESIAVTKVLRSLLELDVNRRETKLIDPLMRSLLTTCSVYWLNSSFQFELHIRQENIEVSLDITQALIINSCMTSYSFFFFFWLTSVVLLSYARQSEWHSFRWNSYPGLSSRLGNEVTARLSWRVTCTCKVALLIDS